MNSEIMESGSEQVSPIQTKKEQSHSNLKELAKSNGIKIGLYKTRLTVTLVMAVHFFAYLFIEGPIGYIAGFKYRKD